LNSAGQLVLNAIRFEYESAAWTLAVPTLTLGSEPLCAIIGPNGSGKSTLLKVAAGLLRPATGEARWQGRRVVDYPRRILAQQVGYLPQECPVLFDYTVEQVVAMGRHAHGGVLELTTPADRVAVDRALADVRLADYRQRRLSQLSGGERRRAWLAAALAQEPAILLLDEPTQALDVHQAAAMMEILTARAAEGLRVVAVLHDLNLAALFCPRLVLLAGGAVVADGPPAELLTPDRLRAVYGDKLDVVPHPRSGQPLVLAATS